MFILGSFLSGLVVLMGLTLFFIWMHRFEANSEFNRPWHSDAAAYMNSEEYYQAVADDRGVY